MGAVFFAGRRSVAGCAAQGCVTQNPNPDFLVLRKKQADANHSNMNEFSMINGR
jgi:hypothetical protein